MKTIKMSDEDYKDLMDLAKELRTQDHDSQANPRMWTVATTHERACKEGYGYTYEVVLSSDYTESIKVEELNKELLSYYNEHGSLDALGCEYTTFLNDETEDNVEEFEKWCKKIFHDNENGVRWVLEGKRGWKLSDYLEEVGIETVTCEEYEKHELNATFFKSDAKKHIEINGHNLNRNPHTYAFSAYRMPKMERLFGILEGLGKDI